MISRADLKRFVGLQGPPGECLKNPTEVMLFAGENSITSVIFNIVKRHCNSIGTHRKNSKKKAAKKKPSEKDKANSLLAMLGMQKP